MPAGLSRALAPLPQAATLWCAAQEEQKHAHRSALSRCNPPFRPSGSLLTQRVFTHTLLGPLVQGVATHRKHHRTAHCTSPADLSAAGVTLGASSHPGVWWPKPDSIFRSNPAQRGQGSSKRGAGGQGSDDPSGGLGGLGLGGVWPGFGGANPSRSTLPPPRVEIFTPLRVSSPISFIRS